ncbi:helix-turn-helix transcriptional regulator [Tsukamurella pseudospumae]|nr:hypothetical protein [Tsukamurella pseudospumae]
MTEFEVTFAVAAITSLDDARVSVLEEELGAFVSVIGDVAEVTVPCVGVGAATAGREAIAMLRRLGVHPEHTVLDVVSPAEIARRAGVTRQAVSSWVRAGEFPRPYLTGDRGLWLWGEVKPWLNARGHALGDEVSYPNREDHTILDYHLLDPTTQSAATALSAAVIVAAPDIDDTAFGAGGFLQLLLERAAVVTDPSVPARGSRAVHVHWSRSRREQPL